MADKTIKDIIRRHTSELMAIPGVVGVAEGRDQDTSCIFLFVVNRSPELLKQLPESLEGYLIKIKESDKFQALGN